MRVLWTSIAVVLLSSGARAQGTLTGYVRDDESLRGLQGAELSVDGSDKRARTDKEGRYTLKDLKPGAIRVHVRFVGFAPFDTILTVSADKPTDGVFFLSKHAVALDTVVSKGRPRLASSGFESFAERREKGFGKFIDSTVLRQNEHRELADLIRDLGAVNVTTPSTCHGDHVLWCSRRVATSKIGTDGICVTQVVLDGTVVSRGLRFDTHDAPRGSTRDVLERYEREKEAMWGQTFDLNSIAVASLVGVELYRNIGDVQISFGGDDAGCGVLVLWTRR